MSDAATAQSAALLKLFNDLWGDVEVGEQVRRRAKALRPDITIPDDHPLANKFRTELQAERAAREALEASLTQERQAAAQARAEAELRANLGKAQSRFALTDEGMAGTIKLMQERQIADAEAAAALYVDTLPKAKPSSATSFLPQKMNLFGTTAKDDAWEKLHVDQEGFFADVVNQVFLEMPVAG